MNGSEFDLEGMLQEILNETSDENYHFSAGVIKAIIEGKKDTAITLLAMMEENIPENKKESLIDERDALLDSLHC